MPDLGNDAADDARDLRLARIGARWGASRTEENLAVTLARIARGQRRRRSGATIAAAGGGAALLAVIAAGAARRDHAVVPPTVADRAAGAPASPGGWQPRVVRLADGSTVSLLDGAGRVRVVRGARDAVEVQLSDGPARFDVPPLAGRGFVVNVAHVSVRISGARFEITPAGDRVKVAVVEGRARVGWPGGADELGPGAVAWFPPAAALVAPPPLPPGSRQRPAGAAGAGPAAESAEDLMRAAESARSSGRPAAAVPRLERLLREYPGDVRAPLAAFSLGRILLAQLRRPAEAADAFALSRRLAPDGVLAPDALAREVEAAARAGDRPRAARLAGEYAARYPGGRRVASVRRFGGLE